MSEPTIIFKIKSLGITQEEYKGMSFGQRLEYTRKIEEWKRSAKSTHISQKRISSSKAISEFKSLYKPKEYYSSFYSKDSSPNYWDDTFEIFYKE